MFSHFWNVNMVFSTSRLVEPFNDLLTFFIFLVCYLRSFLYKDMLLPSFITEAYAQPSAFFFCFQEFFLFFFYVLWDRFPDIFFSCFCFVAQFLWSLGFDIKLYTGVHDALMLSLAIKLHQHLFFFQRSHFKSFLQWSRASLCPCTEAMPTFIFAIK